MKKSIYNYLSKIDGNWVLYNALTDELGILSDKIKTLYEDCTLEEIRHIHPDFYTFLLNKGYAVPANQDETETCIERWEREDNDSKSFTLVINPTLDCNMRCWYCYEKHEACRTMTSEISERIFRFVEKKLHEPELQKFCLSFFGGEPLVQYKKIVRPLAAYACRLAHENKKELTLGFTTNAVLLNPDVLDFLASLNVPVHFQITLDGNKNAHDKIRHTTDGRGTYDAILHNCRNLLDYPQMNLMLRCNYTSKNIATFMDLPGDLELHDITPGESFYVDFHRVWQDFGNDDDEVRHRLSSAREALKIKGYTVGDSETTEKYRCYADRNNHVVVNYDGNLFHCTARDFIPEAAEGLIEDDGTLAFNAQAELRHTLKLGTSACHICRLYPICGGLCSQKKMERKGISGCLAGYTERKKDEILENRVRYLVEKKKAFALK